MEQIRNDSKQPRPKRKYRKGRREPVRWSVGLFPSTPQEICDSARIDFLLEVETCAPRVLQFLAEHVLPKAGTEEFEDRLAEWARTFHLVKDGEPPDWVLRAGRK